MTQPSSTSIHTRKVGINEKLGNISFEQAFDTQTIASAEKAFAKSAETFKAETEADYILLKSIFDNLPAKPQSGNYVRLGEVAFSIKSRASVGGYPLASEIANSFYKFCDAAASTLPLEGYKVAKIHIDALTQVFEHTFPENDAARAAKLVSGLEQLSEKYTLKVAS